MMFFIDHHNHHFHLLSFIVLIFSHLLLSSSFIHHYYASFILSLILGCSTLCLTIRLKDLFTKANGNINYTNDTQQAICIPTAILGIYWMSIAIYNKKALDKDVFFPLSTLLLLTSKHGCILTNNTGKMIISKLCCLFWISSTIYSIFIKGYFIHDQLNQQQHLIEEHFLGYNTFGILGQNSDISIWTNQSLAFPMFNMLLLFIPLPAIHKSMFYPLKDDSENYLFLLSIISLIPVIAGYLSSLRLLGKKNNHDYLS